MEGCLPTPQSGFDAKQSVGHGRWQLVLWSLPAGLILVGGLVAFLLKPYSELPLYRLAGERMLQGEPIYRVTERAFTYPPLFALPFVPLAWLPAWTHRPLWYLVNCGTLAVILICLYRRLQPVLADSVRGRSTPVWPFWLLVGVLAGRHLLSPFENQSHDLITFMCVMLAINALCRAREKTAGMWAGLGTALKATPLLFAPFLLWQKRWLACAALVVGMVAFGALPDVFCPAKDGTSWSMGWYRTFLTAIQPGESATSSAWRPWCQLNQSVAGTTYRLFTPLQPEEAEVGEKDICVANLNRTGLKVLTLGLQLGIVVALWWVTRPGLTQGLPKSERSFFALGEGAALVTAMALVSPTSIKTHFCVLLLPVAFCLADFIYRRRDILTGAALLLAFVLGSLTVKGAIGREFGNMVMAYGSVTWCALALFLATGRVLLQRSSAKRLNMMLPNGAPKAIGLLVPPRGAAA